MPVDSARAALPLWVASVPDPFTPAEGRAAAESALHDTDTVIDLIRSKFQGTLPPGWPRTPELAKAIDDVEISRDAMAALEDHSKGVKLSWAKSSGKVGPALIRVGTALYTRLAELEELAAKSETVPEFLSKLPTLPAVPNPLAGLSTILLIGGAIWALSEGRKLQRLIEGT